MKQMSKLFVGLALITLAFYSCQGTGKDPQKGSSTLFLDKIESGEEVQSAGVETVEFPELLFEEKDWVRGKVKNKDAWLLNRIIENLDNSVMEVEFHFEDTFRFAHDREKVFTTGLLNRFKKTISEAKSLVVKKENWANISGDWSFYDGVVSHRGPDTQYASTLESEEEAGMLLNTEDSFRDGAVRMNFSFDNEEKARHEFLGICFRMKDAKTGNALVITRFGEVKIYEFGDGRIQLKNIYRRPSLIPILDKKKAHSLDIYFFGRVVTLRFDNEKNYQFFTYADDEKGMIGLFTNTNATISNPIYVRADFRERPERNFMGMVSGDKNGRPLFTITRNGLFEGSSKVIIPGFQDARHRNHKLLIVTKNGKMDIALDGASVEQVDGLNHDQLKGVKVFVDDKSRVAIDKIRVAGLGGHGVEAESLIRRIELKSIKEKILRSFRWKKEKKEGFMVGEYKIGRDTRRALLVNSPSKIKLPVEIPSESFLNFGIGIPKEAWETNLPVIFNVILKDGKGEGRVIFSKEIDPADYKQRQWFEQRIDLSEFAGFTGEIHFLTRAKLSGGKGEGKDLPRFALWADPGIFKKRRSDELNVILISIDTLRADHLGCYGYDKDISPNIDRIAKEGTTFFNTFSQAPWTLASHLAMFTSLYPSTFEKLRLRLYTPGISIPQILQEYGYLTGAVTGGGMLSSDFGFSQGFNSQYVVINSRINLAGKEVNNQYRNASRWIKRHKDDKFFLFFHTYELHEYSSKTDANVVRNIKPNDRVKRDIALYDNKINITDMYIGLILQELKDLGILNKTLIVFTSDHGEEFFDHRGWSHARSLYNELIKVPLIVRLPGKIPANKRPKNYVRSVDIKPTIMDILGISGDFPGEGRSVMGIINGTEKGNRDVYSEQMYAGNLKTFIRGDGKKFIFPMDKERNIADGNNLRYFLREYEGGQFYDISSDPHEKKNLIGAQRETAASLKAKIKSIMNRNLLVKKTLRTNKPQETGISKETRERLKALGYLQ